MRDLLKLGRYLKPYWRWAILAPLLMLLEVVMDLLQPRMIQIIVDQGIARGDMQEVIRIGLRIVLLALVGLVGGAGCTIYAVLAAQGFGADLRRVAFGKAQTFSFGDLDHLDTGALITRLTNDVVQIQETVLMLLRIMVRVPLLLAGSLAMAILTSPKLAMMYFFLVPVVLGVLIWIIRKTYPMFGEIQGRLDVLNMTLQENLSGVRVVKAFARSAREIQRFSEANDRLMDQNIVTAQISALTMPFMMLTLNAGVVGTLWFGGVTVIGGGMHVGQVIAFINYLMQTLFSLMMVSMLVLRFSRAGASARRIHEVLAREPDIAFPPDGQRPTDMKGRVSFQNVSFSYSKDGHDPVLKEISFDAEPGETVVILGATGSGKSSLAQLVPRFYDATQGSVSVDGIDVREYDEAALRRKIGVALQESVLFSGTIRDNIRFGRPDATNDEVIAAAKIAQAHDFITGFTDGYDSVVGQRGVNLSGGQKQRIAIARALLVDPSVLILDDSLSAVDLRTEAKIQEGLAKDSRKRTRLIVAQRVTSAVDADRILVLEDGEIAGQGTHEELLASNPVYREIYESQMSNGVISHGGE
jgi:ATP-binding cassette subfamily B protein